MDDSDVRVLLIRAVSGQEQVLLVFEKAKTVKLPDGRSFNKASKWGMPGGRSEAEDKDEVATAEREVRHELNNLPEIIEELRVEREQEHHRKVAFVGYPTPGEIVVDPEEIIEYRWFPIRVLYDDKLDMYFTQRIMAQELNNMRKRSRH